MVLSSLAAEKLMLRKWLHKCLNSSLATLTKQETERKVKKTCCKNELRTSRILSVLYLIIFLQLKVCLNSFVG